MKRDNKSKMPRNIQQSKLLCGRGKMGYYQKKEAKKLAEGKVWFEIARRVKEGGRKKQSLGQGRFLWEYRGEECEECERRRNKGAREHGKHSGGHAQVPVAHHLPYDERSSVSALPVPL